MLRRMRWVIGIAALAAAFVAGAAAGPQAETTARALGDVFFGPRLARAEVVLVQDGAIQDYRIDRGRVKSVSRAALELRELDGSIHVVPLAPATVVELRGQTVPASAIRRGMTVMTIRLQNQPAQRVVIVGGRR